MGYVFGKDWFQMPTTEDQHPIQALTTNRADEPIGELAAIRG